jgi:2-methylfumaryl-CoA hydratase
MNESRPLAGYFFEDYAVGRVFRHAIPRTVTEADASLYLALTGTPHPLHCSRPLASAMGHRGCPLDDLLVFNVAFGSTVADISYNALANLGYAAVRFLAPCYSGDTLSCESTVIGVKANSSGRSGVVYVRSLARNQDGDEVLSWIRWVMVAARGPLSPLDPVVPELPAEVAPKDYRLPSFVVVAALDRRATGSAATWQDYEPGMVIDHPGGATIGESEHVLATRLYLNPARVHFDAFAARDSAFKRPLVYGGHVISICRSLSYFGLENAFAIAAIHGGTHAKPTFAGDTLYCRHVVKAREDLPGRTDVGALRLRMQGVKNKDEIVLDLDYSVLIPRGQNT